MSFKNLPSKTIHETGIQYIVFYPNGYGASIVQHKYSYGGDKGLWELAVIKGDEEEWDICYSTPITSDVLGHLQDNEVDELLTKIEALHLYNEFGLDEGEDEKMDENEEIDE